MPYRICKALEFENAHILRKHPGNCKYPHGHARKVEFVLEADDLDGNDMVCDFKVLAEAMRDYVMAFDHALCMNTEDPNYAALRGMYGERVLGFEGKDPTSEVMARAIFDALKRRLAEYAAQPGRSYPLRAEVRVVKVRLWETRTSWAEYSE